MTVKGTTRDSQALARAINNRERFESSGALSGEYVPGGADGDYGRYLVRSYAEPVAVVDYTKHRAYVTSRKFSVTTSRHQNTTYAALSRVLSVDETTVHASRIDTRGEPYNARMLAY